MTRRRRNIAIAVMLVLVWLGGLAWAAMQVRGSMRQWGMATEIGQAILSHDHAKAEALLRAGADPNAGDYDDTIVFAMQQQDDEMVRLLLRYRANPSRALSQAHDVEQVRKLLALGANPNTLDASDGCTPLMVHCLVPSKPEIVRLLLDHGADPAVRDRSGQTILGRLDFAVANRRELAAQYAEVRAMIEQAIAARRKR